MQGRSTIPDYNLVLPMPLLLRIVFIYLHMHLRHALFGDGQPQYLLINRNFKVARFLQCYGTTSYIMDAATLLVSMMLMI